MQSVPTTVVRGPDGAYYYVGELTGFPFPVGGARVWRVVPGHQPTVFAADFTNIIDITFDRRGHLLVLEIFKNGLLSGDPTGALVRVARDGSRTEIASAGLVTPTSVAVGEDNALYVVEQGHPGGRRRGAADPADVLTLRVSSGDNLDGGGSRTPMSRRGPPPRVWDGGAKTTTNSYRRTGGTAAVPRAAHHPRSAHIRASARPNDQPISRR
jgi:hypothetical protein